MTQHEFELAVTRMWATTRIPLTQMNVLAYTGAPRERIERWMNELIKAGLAELDSDEDGDMLWRIRGAKRSANGPRSLDDVSRLERLAREVDAERPRGLSSPARLSTRMIEAQPEGPEEKSLVASGLLSFFFGPVGWLYAAPLNEAVPAIVGLMIATSLLTAILPYALAMSILGVVSPISAAAGVVYAWRHNQTGRRASMLELLSKVRKQLPPGR